MFKPTKMSEVDIFCYDDQINVVAQAIARSGLLHLMDSKLLGKWAANADGEWNSRATLYGNMERRVLDLVAQLKVEQEPGRCPEALDPRTDAAIIESSLQQAEERIGALREREAACNQTQSRWELIARSMEKLAPLQVVVSDLRQLDHLHLVAGTLPAENIARLESSLFRIPYTILPVHQYGHRYLVFALCAQEHAPILDRALQSAFLEPLAIPEEFSGTAQQVLEQVAEHQLQTASELEEIEAQYQQIAIELAPELLDHLTRIQADRALASAMTHFGHRGNVYLIAGWVPTDQVDELRAIVEQASGGAATFEENPPEMLGTRHSIPTQLRNPRFLRAIEGLVKTYGIPGYHELDPTVLVAITFVTMFGIMFGDLGHGLVLSLLGGVLALGMIRPLAKQSDLGYIFLACGLSSSLFGVLYGSLFGMENVIPHLWLSPMHDILSLLAASIVLGVIILNIGFLCRIRSALLQNALLDAIFDKNGLAGFALYWCLGGIVLFVATGKNIPGVLVIAALLLMISLFLAEPLTNWIKGHRPIIHGSIPELLVQAFFELFEALIGYISNTLSYVRLGAFAVAHAGLSMVVFILADMLGGNPSLAFVRPLVIVFGNIAIIGFEGLIVGIQTLRLEYYELFGKFYYGGGIPYQPLTLPNIDCQIAASI